MATPEELRREQELLTTLEAKAGVNREILADLQSQNNVILDQLQNFQFQRSEKTEIRNITRELNKVASSNYDTSIKELGSQKQIANVTKAREATLQKISNLTRLATEFQKTGTREGKELAAAIRDQVGFAEELANELGNIQVSSEAIRDSFGVKGFEGLAKFFKSLPGLSVLAPTFQNAADITRETAATNAITKEMFKTGTGLTKKKIQELGLEKQLGGLTGAAAAKKAKILGLDQKILKTNNARNKVAASTLDILSKTASVAVVGGLVNSFFKLNSLQTEFRRLTGETADNFTELNDTLISGIDSVKTLINLTEQFGFNANNAFSQINVQEATELEVLLGLSAQEAGNLAFFAQAAGQNLNTVANEINDSTDGAISVKQVLQDVSSVSESIALSFGKSVQLIGKTAAEARLLGLNLRQVDGIASGLLDIESSLAAEFEAEVVTGRQLNLERARFFALTNDLAGLTEEIGKNEEILSVFATGTRIEQEAIASALNLSRDEVSKMILDQNILNDMTEEERIQSELDAKKRLSLQESFTKSVEKLTVALAGPVEAFASLVSNSTVLYATLGAIVGLSLARVISSVITLGTTLATTAASAGALKAFLSPAGLVASLVLLGAIGGGIAALLSKTKSSVEAQNVPDGIAPASKGPFTITDSFGAMAVTAKGDGLAVSPNIRREGRDTPTSVVLSDQQIQKIANAVRDGASKATINLDGNRVSSNLQTPMVLNTLPGV